MKYCVIELQKNAEGVLTPLVSVHDTKEEAESKYHSVLAYAAVSEIPVHSATILTEEGFCLAYKHYKH